MTPRLSVVIPTRNEAAVLPGLLAALREQSDIALECIVADGDSDDGTPELAKTGGARVVDSPAGRGRQLNAGARAAHAPWLLFLHADSALESRRQLRDAVDLIETERDRANGPVAGHFALRFARRQPGHDRLYDFLEAKTASNRPYTINGDQGMLLHRDDFDALGGFDESLPIFEDQRLAARIFETGRWLLLPGRLQTSARRLETEGHGPRLKLMALMMAMHEVGLDVFLRDTPRIYSEQRDARRLRLAPFARRALRLLTADGTGQAVRRIRAGGHFIRTNAWQLALLADLRHQAAGTDWQTRLDQLRGPRALQRPADLLCGMVALAWLSASCVDTGRR